MTRRFVSFPDHGLIIPSEDVREIKTLVQFQHSLSVSLPATPEDTFRLTDRVTAVLNVVLLRNTDPERVEPEATEALDDDGNVLLDEDGNAIMVAAEADVTAIPGLLLHRIEVPFGQDVEPLLTSSIVADLPEGRKTFLTRQVGAYLNFLRKKTAYEARLLRDEAGEDHPPGEALVQLTDAEREQAAAAMEKMSSKIAELSYSEPAVSQTELINMLRIDGPTHQEMIGRIQAASADAIKKVLRGIEN